MKTCKKNHILYRKEHFDLPQVRAFVDIAQRYELESKPTKKDYVLLSIIPQ